MFVEIKHKYQENSVGVQYFAVNPKLVTNHKIFLIKDKKSFSLNFECKSLR